MKYLSLIVAASVLTCSACSNTPEIHLVGDEGGSKGDIQISGDTGLAKWSWGPTQYEQALVVTENQLSGVGSLSSEAPLTVKLKDGTVLTLTGGAAGFVCGIECHDIHMPTIWHYASK